MNRIKVTTGDVYGELTVVREVEATAGKRHVLCQCVCGQQRTVRLGHLSSGHSTSCGKCGIAHNGQRKTIAAWAAQYGINKSTLRARLKAGLDIGEALKRGKDK